MDVNAPIAALVEHEFGEPFDYFTGPDDENLAPVAVLDDGQGGTIEVYADRSFCTKADGRLAPANPETLSAP